MVRWGWEVGVWEVGGGSFVKQYFGFWGFLMIRIGVEGYVVLSLFNHPSRVVLLMSQASL